MGWNLIIQFLILTVVISGVIIFALYMVLIRTVDGAKQRLDRDAEAARRREAELNQKIKEADAELKRRKKELDVIEKKLRHEMEEQAGKEKEELLNKARLEAEDIIVKAQNACEAIRRDIEKTMEIKVIDYAAGIITDVLSFKIKDNLDKYLVAEFIEKLKKVDMSRLGADIKVADVISASAMPESLLTQIAQVLKDKLSRDIKVNPKVDSHILGGVVLMFGSLQLDGSLHNALKESTDILKQQIEKQYSN